MWIEQIKKIRVFNTCTVVSFTNGINVCSHDTLHYGNDTALMLAPSLRPDNFSPIDLSECLIAYWVDKHHKQWFFTRQDEEFLQDAAELFPDRIYFILIPADI